MVLRAARQCPVRARPAPGAVLVGGDPHVCGVRYRRDLLLGDPDGPALVCGSPWQAGRRRLASGQAERARVTELKSPSNGMAKVITFVLYRTEFSGSMFQ